MRQFARFPSAERAALFAQAAATSGFPSDIIEKDFWVCWMLDRLWSLPDVAPHLIFKGGTSLSKCFGLIQRFSEDIDIGVDRALLGFDASNDPEAEGLTRSARNRRVEALKNSAKTWIESQLLPQLSVSIEAELGQASQESWNWQLSHEDDGMPLLRWTPPPSIFKRRRAASQEQPYVRTSIWLEIGSRSARWPAGQHELSSYVAQQIPQAFQSPTTSVCTLEPSRTFWEKVTILHVLFHETRETLEAGKPAKERERFSRHCSDICSIAAGKSGQTALRDFDLLAEVVAYKRKMFCSSNVKEAQYDDARPGTLHLVPHPALDEFFARDYAQMQSSGMFFGPAFSWSQIRQTLQNLEEQINA